MIISSRNEELNLVDVLVNVFHLCMHGCNYPAGIKTHSSVSAAKITKEDVQHTSVLFTGTIKLLNSAFCISKTTKWISTKFVYFLPYIYTTSHIKIEGNRFRSSQDIHFPENCSIFFTFLNQARTGLRPTCSWFLEIVLFVNIGVCVCVCPPPRALITSHVKGMCNNRIR